jgi:hypothetical protein
MARTESDKQTHRCHTVKATNFGPHKNFGPFRFSKGFAIIKSRPTGK